MYGGDAAFCQIALTTCLFLQKRQCSDYHCCKDDTASLWKMAMLAVN